MLPLFLRSVGFALKIQLQNCNPAYQLLLEKPSQNPICTLQNHPGWLAFWLTDLQLPRNLPSEAASER